MQYTVDDGPVVIDGIMALPIDAERLDTEELSTTCQRTLWGEPGGLRCVRPAGHAHAHAYRCEE